MSPWSTNWKSVEGLDTSIEQDSRIQQILSNANFQILIDKALLARNTPDLTASFDLNRCAYGLSNLVLRLEFSDDVVWIARIRFSRGHDDATEMLSEVTTMKLVRERTSVPVAQIYLFDQHSDNPFGYPYIVMEQLRGHSVSNGLACSIPVSFHSKVAKEVAKVVNELGKLTFTNIGRLITTREGHVEVSRETDTSLEWFYSRRYQQNSEVHRLHPNDRDWNTSCWIFTLSPAYFVIPDKINGPFPLCHLDFHYGNMLFDEEYNLTGIIDWTGAQVAPFEQSSVILDILTYPGAAKERNEVILNFKALLVKAIAELESDSLPVNDELLSTYISSSKSEIAMRYYMTKATNVRYRAPHVAKLMFQNELSWDQLVAIYGDLPTPKGSETSETDG